jgi:predicted nucleotidyltransferase
LAPGAEAYLFGSRTDPTARGGDIDVLLLTEQRLALATVRRIRRAILDRIGEQKLDIVNFAREERHPFKDVALARAARL